MTSEACKKISISLKVRFKFFWMEGQSDHYIIPINNVYEGAFILISQRVLALLISNV
jgi:hypothetical protein